MSEHPMGSPTVPPGTLPPPRAAGPAELADFGPARPANAASPVSGRDLSLLADIPVEVSVELGRLRLPLRELLNLEPGTVLELDRAADAPVDVLVNGRLVARGEVVVLDGEFGVRVTSLVERDG